MDLFTKEFGKRVIAMARVRGALWLGDDALSPGSVELLSVCFFSVVMYVCTSGKMMFANGAVYEGEWRRDFCAGHGELRGKGAEGIRWVYKGNFKGGHQHSDDGVCTYTRETLDELYQKKMVTDYGEYRGRWRKGNREGHGIMQVVDENSPHFGTYDGTSVMEVIGILGCRFILKLTPTIT